MDVRRTGSHPGAAGLEDADAVARVLAGDTEAFALLVTRYQGPLYRYAVSMVLDHDAAADMVQDAFVRAYAKLGTCRDHARFAPWLFQALRNRCLDHLKRPARRCAALETAESVPDPAPGPDARAEQRRVRRDIRTALAGLPVAQREAFLMHYVEGVPYEEMADRLDVSVGALKMRSLRAREALAAALRADVTPEAPGSSYGMEAREATGQDRERQRAAGAHGTRELEETR